MLTENASQKKEAMKNKKHNRLEGTQNRETAWGSAASDGNEYPVQAKKKH